MTIWTLIFFIFSSIVTSINCSTPYYFDCPKVVWFILSLWSIALPKYSYRAMAWAGASTWNQIYEHTQSSITKKSISHFCVAFLYICVGYKLGRVQQVQIKNACSCAYLEWSCNNLLCLSHIVISGNNCHIIFEQLEFFVRMNGITTSVDNKKKSETKASIDNHTFVNDNICSSS